MVIQAYSRRSIVAAAGRDGFRMKPVHHGAVLRREGDMGARLREAAPTDPEEGLGRDSVARGRFAFRIQTRDPQWTQREIIEVSRSLDVADPDGDVIEHITTLHNSCR